MGTCPRAELIASHQTEHGLTWLHPGGTRGGPSPPVGTVWGGGPCSAGAGGDGVRGPCPARHVSQPMVGSGCPAQPWAWGSSPCHRLRAELCIGAGAAPRSTPPPPAWGYVLGPLPVPHNYPGTGHHPSMFEDNFPNGCFYFIACNKAKRPTSRSSALPQGGLDTALTPPPASLPRAAAPPTPHQAHGGQGMGSCPHPCTPCGGGKQVR